MFQWLRFYTLDNGDPRRPAGTPAIEAFGPDHPDNALAVAWLREQVAAGVAEGVFRLAGAPVRTRTVIVLDGLDDDATPAAPAAVQAPAAVADAPAPAEGKRRGRPPKSAQDTPPAAPVAPAVDAPAPEGERNAGPYACLGCGVMPGAMHKIDCPNRQPGLPGVPVMADAAADDSPAPVVTTGVDVAEGLLEVEVPDVAPAAADVAQAIVGDVAPATGPRVDLDGTLVQINDGAGWYHQRFQTVIVAEKTAHKAKEALVAAADGNDKALRGLLVMFRPGQAAPAEVPAA